MGLSSTKSFPVIHDDDLKRLAVYFAQDFMTQKIDTRKLQQAVIFYIMFYTCRRGRENLYTMKPDSFKIFVEPDGSYYIQQVTDELEKNHQEDSKDPANKGKIFETGGKKSLFCNKKWSTNL